MVALQTKYFSFISIIRTILFVPIVFISIGFIFNWYTVLILFFSYPAEIITNISGKNHLLVNYSSTPSALSLYGLIIVYIIPFLLSFIVPYVLRVLKKTRHSSRF